LALLGNYSVFNKWHGKYLHGPSVGDTRPAFGKSSSIRNSYTTFNRKNAYPVGYLAPYAWVLPQNSGGMGSTSRAGGVISVSANLAGGRNLTASAAMTITPNAPNLDLIVSGVGSASMVISASASMSGAASMQATSTGFITAETITIGAIFSVEASSAMVLTETATISALAFMTASAGGPTALSPEGLAASLWGALASDYNDAGTMGELLNAAGGSASPTITADVVWSRAATSVTTTGSMGEQLKKAKTAAENAFAVSS
jgi:hypothetical protein